MKVKRWGWLVSLLALSLVLACGDEATERLGTPPPTEPSTPPPVLTAGELPTPTTADEEFLASMLLTAQEVAQVIPGQMWSEGTALGFVPSEHRAGLIAEWGGTLVSREDFEVRTSLALYETDDGARGLLETVLAALAPSEFDADDIGDEGEGNVIKWNGSVSTSVALRAGRVFAYMAIDSVDGDEMREEALQLARQLADKIQAALEGSR